MISYDSLVANYLMFETKKVLEKKIYIKENNFLVFDLTVKNTKEIKSNIIKILHIFKFYCPI